MSSQFMVMSQMLAQARAAQEVMSREHDMLLAAGFKWDGMDGYLGTEANQRRYDDLRRQDDRETGPRLPALPRQR